MMFASRNRSRAIRRWLPLNSGARGALGAGTSGRNAGEDRICCGGAPAHRGGLGHERRRSRRDRREAHVQSSATISAHRKPASSRATAAATTERTFLWAASWRKRLERRTWAVQERATVAGATSTCRWRMPTPTLGRVLIGPGRFAQLASEVGVASAGDGAPALALARRVLRGHQSCEAHERPGPGEAPPVEDLGGQAQTADAGHAPVGGESWHLGSEGLPPTPWQQIGLDRLEGRVAPTHGGQVVGEGRRQGAVFEVQPRQPSLVALGPRRSAPPDHRVAQQEAAEAVAGSGEILHHVAPGAAQVPHRLLGRGGDGHGGELTGAVQTGQAAGIAPVGLDPITRALGDE